MGTEKPKMGTEKQTIKREEKRAKEEGEGEGKGKGKERGKIEGMILTFCPDNTDNTGLTILATRLLAGRIAKSP